jgi:hypothetical protein
MQAPASRIEIDLPDGFEASRLFAGFTHEAFGISFIVVELPAKAYEEVAAGMTPEALAAKGVRNARRAALPRPGAYIYMQAEQTSPAGHYAKFFVLFREGEVTALITANVPKASLEKGEVKAADIEMALAAARITAAAAPARDLFALAYLGPFKPAGSLLGTSRAFTLDGRMEPSERASARPLLIVAPSLDRRPIEKPAIFADSLIAGLANARDVRIAERRQLTVSGMKAYEAVATATDGEGGAALVLYQLLLLPKAGGYFRIVGQAGADERDTYVHEFRRIAETFRVVE